jgi:hypothetical protein
LKLERKSQLLHVLCALQASPSEQPSKFCLMVFILLSLHIILKENFNLVVHLWANIFEKEAGNDSKTTKAK